MKLLRLLCMLAVVAACATISAPAFADVTPTVVPAGSVNVQEQAPCLGTALGSSLLGAYGYADLFGGCPAFDVVLVDLDTGNVVATKVVQTQPTGVGANGAGGVTFTGVAPGNYEIGQTFGCGGAGLFSGFQSVCSQGANWPLQSLTCTGGSFNNRGGFLGSNGFGVSGANSFSVGRRGETVFCVAINTAPPQPTPVPTTVPTAVPTAVPPTAIPPAPIEALVPCGFGVSAVSVAACNALLNPPATIAPAPPQITPQQIATQVAVAVQAAAPSFRISPPNTGSAGLAAPQHSRPMVVNFAIVALIAILSVGGGVAIVNRFYRRE